MCVCGVSPPLPRRVTPSPALRGWMWAVTVEASAVLPIHLESGQKEADRLPASAYIMWEEGGLVLWKILVY